MDIGAPDPCIRGLTVNPDPEGAIIQGVPLADLGVASSSRQTEQPGKTQRCEKEQPVLEAAGRQERGGVVRRKGREKWTNGFECWARKLSFPIQSGFSNSLPGAQLSNSSVPWRKGWGGGREGKEVHSELERILKTSF